MSAAPSKMVGIVVSAGKMQRAVKVRVAGQAYNSYIKKHFRNHKDYLVSDPNSSIRLGDVVRIEDAGRQLSRRIKHVVTEIIAPWGPAIDERPNVLNAVEIREAWKQKYDAKIERRTGRKPASSGEVGVQDIAEREGSRETRELKRETVEDKVEGMVAGTMVAS